MYFIATCVLEIKFNNNNMPSKRQKDEGNLGITERWKNVGISENQPGEVYSSDKTIHYG